MLYIKRAIIVLVFLRTVDLQLGLGSMAHHRLLYYNGDYVLLFIGLTHRLCRIGMVDGRHVTLDSAEFHCMARTGRRPIIRTLLLLRLQYFNRPTVCSVIIGTRARV